MFNNAMQLVKVGYAFTEEGHKYDEDTNKASAKLFRDDLKAAQDYRIARTRKNAPDLVTSGLDNFVKSVARNKYTYLANKHKKGENSHNPFGGYTDKSFEENRGAVGV
jgi:hypothetical protein